MGGFTGLAVDVAEAGARKAAQSAEPAIAAAGKQAAKDLTEFATEHFGLGTALARGKSGPYIKGLLDTHKDVAGKMGGQIERNIGQHFVRPREQVSPNEIMHLANTKASDHVFGNNRELLIGGIEAYRKEHGDIAARNLVDQLGVHFHEQAFPLQTGGQGSKLAMQLRKTPSAVSQQLGLSTATKDVDWGVSPYKAPADWEVIGNVAVPLAQKSGVLHLLGGFPNLLMDSSLRSSAGVIAGMFTGDRAGFVASKNAVGGMVEYALENQRQLYEYENGITKNLPNKPIWKALQGNILIPGMSAARKFHLINYSHQGELEAHYITKDLLSGDINKGLAGYGLSRVERAQKQAEVYGMNWRGIMNRGYLLDDDIITAIQTNVRRKLMTDTSDLRYKAAIATPIGRVVSRLRSFATGQRGFILDSFRHSIQQRDPIAFLRNMAILSTIYPDVGATARYIGDLWTGKDEKEAREKMEQTWRWSVTPEGYTTGKAWADRMDALLHLTGLGLISSYYRAMLRHQFSNELLGPVFGPMVKTTEDLAGALSGKSSVPVKRDLLHELPMPIVGPYLAGKLYPSGGPQARIAHRRAALKGAAKKKYIKEMGY